MEISVNSKFVDLANSLEGEAREMASRAFKSLITTLTYILIVNLYKNSYCLD